MSRGDGPRRQFVDVGEATHPGIGQGGCGGRPTDRLLVGVR